MGKHRLPEKESPYEAAAAAESTAIRLIPVLEALKPPRPRTLLMGLTLAGKPLLFDLESKAFHHMLIEEAREARAAEILMNLVCSLALTTLPAQVQLFPVDVGGRALVALEGLPHSPRGMVGDPESLQSLLDVLANEVKRREESKSSSPHVVVAVHELHLLPRRGLETQMDRLLASANAGGPLGVHLLMTGGLGTKERLKALEQLHGLTLVAPAPDFAGVGWKPLVITAGQERTAFTTGGLTVHELDWACRQIGLGGRLDFRPRGVGLWPAASHESARGHRDVRGERPRR